MARLVQTTNCVRLTPFGEGNLDRMIVTRASNLVPEFAGGVVGSDRSPSVDPLSIFPTYTIAGAEAARTPRGPRRP
jgi:hypothetical protein